MFDGETPVIPGLSGFRPLGSGASATVWLARQDAFDRAVAVKVLRGVPDADTAAAFARECRAIGAVSHPHIVGVLEATVDAMGRPAMVMEWCPGGTFADLVADGPLPVDEVLDVGVRLADALQAAHDAGVVHCDVKPGNVLVRRDGGPALADFGISVLASEVTDAPRAFSIHHAAPEVLVGADATVRSDVWSLAATLTTLLLGHPPFAVPGVELPRAELVHRVRTAAAPTIPGGPPALGRLLRTALAKDPLERPESAAELAAALRDVQRVTGRPVTPATGHVPDLHAPEPRPPSPAPDGSATRPPVLPAAPVTLDQFPPSDAVARHPGTTSRRRPLLLAVLTAVGVALLVAVAGGTVGEGPREVATLEPPPPPTLELLLPPDEVTLRRVATGVEVRLVGGRGTQFEVRRDDGSGAATVRVDGRRVVLPAAPDERVCVRVVALGTAGGFSAASPLVCTDD